MHRKEYLLPVAVALIAATPLPALNADFTRAMDAAMDRMMESAGNVDRDFVTMMIPHHQGAIDMAVA